MRRPFYVQSSCCSAIELEKVNPESIEPEPEVQKTFSEEANTSSYYPAAVPVMDKYILENGKVHLGSGIWVDGEKWHQLQVTQGDSKYTKNLAVMIWGTDVLKNRSVTGVATKKKKDAIPKPPLSPHKLSIVRGLLKATMKSHHENPHSEEHTHRMLDFEQVCCYYP
uniref:BEN domain-containing protein 5 n=1 Tax=Sphaerodactylus townsendi TaxID=933632 RepID=A0ACB8F3X7_9SAUR